MASHQIQTYSFKNAIRVFNIGDVHRGNASCDVEFFKKMVDIIKKEPRTYWLSTGDLLEAATKNSKSDSYEALNIQEELNLLAEELAPIKHKCLGFVASNHHNRVNRDVGLSLDEILANKINIPYLGITGLIKVTVGTSPYYICLHHGIGGGTQGGKVNNAIRITHNFVGADIYMSGHTHTYSHVPFMQQIIDRHSNSIKHMLSHSIVTGHCIKWKDSYAEKIALHPAPVGFSYVDIVPSSTNKDKHKCITPGFFDSNMH